MDRYMSIGDAAKALGVVPATVKLMLRNGRLVPAARTVGGIYLFDPSAVQQLAEDRQASKDHTNVPDGRRTKQEVSHE